jgi:PAS domain S-box-containing protein
MQEFKLAAKNLESYKSLNEQLCTIFESSFDGIWVCDRDGKIIRINKASERLNGIKAQDVIGKRVIDAVEMGLFDRSVTEEVLKTKRQVSIVQYIRSAQKYLLVTGTPTFDEEGNISLVVVNERDMTQLNAIKEQLKQSRMVTERYKDELAGLSLLELKNQNIIAESKEMRQVLETALKLARLDASNILILGESGTGKGLLAKFIHKNGRYGKRPFIQINCAALPETLLEAELFGYERGAFTGAREQGKVGLFELAHEGTLFLDEIGDLPLSVQAKLLKYLDDNEIMRLGSTTSKKIQCKIIAATNRNLERQVRVRKFRKDLFYRLNTFIIRIQPLRERSEDILELALYFLRKFNDEYNQRRKISYDALDLLQSHPFFGNVRELANVLKRAVVMSDKDDLDEFIVRNLNRETKKWPGFNKQDVCAFNLSDGMYAAEREFLEKAMTQCKSTREMARFLGISQPTVVRKIKKYRLSHIRYSNASK